MATDPQIIQSTQTTVPAYAQPYYEELMKQAGKQTYTTDASGAVTGVRTYQPYTAERVAGFTPQQLAVQTEAAGLKAPTQFGTATTQLGTMAGIAGLTAPAGLTQAFGYTPGTTTTGTFTAPGIAASYMSPYQQQVTDVAKREAQRQADIQKAGAAMGSIGRGTFGGGRQALMQGEQDRATQQLLADIQAKGGQAAYEQAMQAFQQDQARALQAQQQTQQAQQYAAGLGKDLGLAGLTTGVETAKTIGQLGATEQIANLERLKAQAASAAEQRAYQQEIDNVKYQNFMEAQDYQRKLLEYQSGILQGTAGALGQTQVQYAPPPSLASQIGGLGLAGLGLYNVMSGQGTTK